MTTSGDKANVPLKLAVASLLRLASWTLKDAELLSAGRNPANAPFLVHVAVNRVVEAVIATEHGWPTTSKTADSGDLPDENPLKLALIRLVKLAHPTSPLVLLRDGTIPDTFDRDGFREDVAAVRSVLDDLAIRFGVDLLGVAPAEQTAPIRTEAARNLESKPKHKLPRIPSPELENIRPQPEPTPQRPAQNDNPRPPIVLPPRPSKKVATPRTHEVEGRSPINMAPDRATTTSTAFWTLMDGWRVPDLVALELIKHSGGLTKKGTRPRFKLSDAEAQMVKLLAEIDQALMSLGLSPESWLKRPVDAAPFNGATLIAYLTHNGLEGIKATSRYILKNGLKLSMSGAR